MKKVFTLLTLLLCAITSSWAGDYQLKASTCSSSTTWTFESQDFTLDPAHGGGGQNGYTDYIKFSKNKTYTLTLPDNFTLTNINNAFSVCLCHPVSKENFCDWKEFYVIICLVFA